MKSLKKLLIPLAILLVLIILTVVWFLIKPSIGSGEVNEFDKNVVVYKADEVKKITVTKADGTSVSAEVEDIDSERVWNLVNSDTKEGVNYSSTKIETWVIMLSQVVANSLIDENPSDLALYGLDNPEYVIDITLRDGSTRKVLLGNNTYDNVNVYFMSDSSTAVYTTVAMKSQFADYSPIDFIDSKIYTMDYSNLSKIKFERFCDDYIFEADCVYDSSTAEPSFYFTSPFSIKASPYFKNLVDYVATFEVAKFIDLTDDEITAYGLDNPSFHFTFIMNDGETYEIYLSKNIGGFFYGYTNVSEDYFTVSDMQIKYLETPILELLDSYICYQTVSDISSIKYTSDDLSFEFKIDTKDSISSEEATVSLNSRNAKIYSSDNRCYAAVLYEALSCIEINGIELDANPELNSSVNICFYRKDYDTQNIDFVVRDNDTYYVFINGTYTGFYVNMKEFIVDGGTDTYNYGIIPAYNLLTAAIENNINNVYDIPEN
ncbi:MAG: DUF4340 domain-containing protein [Clostridia bacterium]|nr:DUF4340 domain-containing protein [Clostridia bacterium]